MKRRLTISDVPEEDEPEVRLGNKQVSVVFRMSFSTKEKIQKGIKEFRKLTGRKLTASFLYREGALELLRVLRVQAVRVRKGEFHAKRRKADFKPIA